MTPKALLYRLFRAPPKYGFTGRVKTLTMLEHSVREIVALRDFGCVKKGERGGWVENDDNLSQEGNCWLGPDCYAMHSSRITDNALVFGSNVHLLSGLCFRNHIKGNAVVTDGHVKTSSKGAVISGNAMVSGSRIGLVRNSHISGNVIVYAEGLILRFDTKITNNHALIGKVIEVVETPALNYLMRPVSSVKTSLSAEAKP